MNLDGKNALVTGAAHGLGNALASQLDAMGCKLMLVDQDGTGLETMQGVLSRPAVGVFLCDLGEPAQRARLVALVNETGLQIDLLINCAGIGSHSCFDQFDMAEAARVLQVNALAPVELVAGLRERFPKRTPGCIVNIGSLAGELHPPGMSLYAASKAALHTFSRSLSLELAGTNMRCLLVILGAMRGTHFTSSIRHPASGQPAWYRRLDADPQAAARAIIQAICAGHRRLVYPAWYAWVLGAARCAGPLSEFASRQAFQKLRRLS